MEIILILMSVVIIALGLLAWLIERPKPKPRPAQPKRDPLKDYLDQVINHEWFGVNK